MDEAEHHFDGRAKLKMQDNQQRKSNWIEEERHKLQAYEYLCHIGEAKQWIEACLKTEIGAIEKLAEELRNGIVLARLAQFFHQGRKQMRIFEDLTKLQYRHSDNINIFFAACKAIKTPEIFMFELIDLYEKKNIPKVIYCIHALSHLLYKMKLAPRISDLLGKLEFSDDILNNTAEGLESSGVSMPAFGNIQNALAAELKDESTEQESNDIFIIERLAFLNNNMAKVIIAQSIVRMHAQRKTYIATQKHYRDGVKEIVLTQRQIRKRAAKIRGAEQREKYLQRLNFLKLNSSSAIKLQAWYRGRHAFNQYRALRLGKGGASAKVLQEYIKMLDDNLDEFDEERNLDSLRQNVLVMIRSSSVIETQVLELDTKIALLVKNRISLEEVVGFTSKQMRSHIAHSQSSNLNKENSILTLKSNDKAVVDKRKRYSELFYLLQVQPQYLAKLAHLTNKNSAGQSTKIFESTILTIFGQVQSPREEYLFLGLVELCIQKELSEIENLEDFWRESPMFIGLALQYMRGAKERQFLRSLLQPLVKSVMDNSSLELETEPVAIFRMLIREQEVKTGEKSSRNYDTTPAEAAADPEVAKIQIFRINALKTIATKFLGATSASISTMPYGIRYIAMSIKGFLHKKFPAASSEAEINRIVGNLIYYRYINPAIIAPEAFDIIETTVSPAQRKNLAEVAKLIHQVQVTRIIPGDSITANALNQFVTASSARFDSFIKSASTVELPGDHFGYDEFLDTSKPSIYITPEEIVKIHIGLWINLADISDVPTDPLNVLMKELGDVPAIETAAKGTGTELTLPLHNRFAKSEKPEEAEKRLLTTETKLLIKCIVRINIGKSLLKILEEPVSPEMQLRYEEYLKVAMVKIQPRFKSFGTLNALNKLNSTSEMAISVKASQQINNSEKESVVKESNRSLQAGAFSGSVQSGLEATGSKTKHLQHLMNKDDTYMTFGQLKCFALEMMARLEKLGVCTVTDEYQSMLDSIVDDMLSKQKRRAARSRELKIILRTVQGLENKTQYLNDQKKSYHDYIDGCMLSFQSKQKGKAKKPQLFSKQYYHVKDIQKSGMTLPQFGSFKFTAGELHKKGVLISIDGYSTKQFGGISLTISSNETGVFNVEVLLLGVKVAEPMEMRLDDLLQDQYNKVDVMTLFDMAKVNLNLLIFLINKK